MRVALFGAYDASYPRAAVFREALASQGVEVCSIAASPGAAPVGRESALALRWARAARGLDALIVPAFGHRDVPLASFLGRLSGTPVLFDPLVSRWDTQVHDLGRCRDGTLSSRRLRASDRISLSLADLILCDTWEHGDFYSREYGVPRRKLFRVPVGADETAFASGGERVPRDPAAPVQVTYVGGFIPLHGVETIVEAASILERRRGDRFARFTLLGSGMTAARADRDIAARGLRSVRRLPRASYAEALAALVRSDVALGIFGTTPKAARVVPHKVFQAMALGVATVSRRSPAITEFFRDGEHLALVPAGDPRALAAAVEALALDPAGRERLGAAGRAAARDQASPAGIGGLLVEAIRLARDSTAPRVRR